MRIATGSMMRVGFVEFLLKYFSYINGKDTKKIISFIKDI